MTAIRVDRSDATVDAICRAAFPNYRGRTVQLRQAESFTLSGTYWDGGTRSSYAAVTLSDVPRAKSLPHFNPPQFGGPRTDPVVELDPRSAIVEHVIFCGKDLGLRIYARPEALTPMLPESVELDQNEGFVLTATAHLKAHYAGKDRFDNSHYERALKLPEMTREDWEAAKARLIGRKLLNKRGAITNDGRNAVEGKRL